MGLNLKPDYGFRTLEFDNLYWTGPVLQRGPVNDFLDAKKQ